MDICLSYCSSFHLNRVFPVILQSCDVSYIMKHFGEMENENQEPRASS